MLKGKDMLSIHDLSVDEVQEILALAKELKAKLEAVGGRVEIYGQNEPMRVKIAKAQQQKIPYMLVLGDQEIANGQVSVRERHEGDLGTMAVEDICKIIKEAQV